MPIGRFGHHAAARGALDEAAAEEERLDVVFQCVGGDAHAVSDGA